MNYIIIGIITIVGFLAYQAINKNKAESTNKNYSSNFNIEKKITKNDKQILIENVEYNLVKKAVQDFTKNYDNSSQNYLKPISKLHKIENNRVLITFPYDIDFEIFCYYVNYLKYPMNLNYKADVKAWASTKGTENWLNKEFENKKVMLFLDPNDDEFDNVMLINEKGRTYKIGFAVGFGLQNHNETIFKYKSSDFNNSELENYESEEIK